MPKNSTADILRRWRAMDLLLWKGQLVVPTFAKKYGVSLKTVRRDLDGFEELGQKIREQVDPEGGRAWIWVYEEGTEPLFRHPKPPAKPAAPAGG